MTPLSGLAPAEVIEALFATISYRLEPQGRATRFPNVIDSLYAGRLDSKDAPAALIELGHIEAGLKALPPDRAVWSFTDLRRIDDSDRPVNHAATNLYEYFIADDGELLVAHLRQAIQNSMLAKRNLTFKSRERKSSVGSALALLLIGLVWTIAGYLFFPHRILVPRGGHEGPLLWSLGILAIAGGLVFLLMALRPNVDKWVRRRPNTALIVFAAVTLLLLYLSWGRGSAR